MEPLRLPRLSGTRPGMVQLMIRRTADVAISQDDNAALQGRFLGPTTVAADIRTDIER
jgi:hypothetical protein